MIIIITSINDRYKIIITLMTGMMMMMAMVMTMTMTTMMIMVLITKMTVNQKMASTWGRLMAGGDGGGRVGDGGGRAGDGGGRVGDGAGRAGDGAGRVGDGDRGDQLCLLEGADKLASFLLPTAVEPGVGSKLSSGCFHVSNYYNHLFKIFSHF